VRDIDTAEVDSLKVLDPNPPIREADIRSSPKHVSFGPIVLKKSKMPLQQNSRKSELIADFGWQCALRAFGKATE
jgi:hypothetical protein